jgi:hypothetical protein
MDSKDAMETRAHGTYKARSTGLGRCPDIKQQEFGGWVQWSTFGGRSCEDSSKVSRGQSYYIRGWAPPVEGWTYLSDPMQFKRSRSYTSFRISKSASPSALYDQSLEDHQAILSSRLRNPVWI